MGQGHVATDDGTVGFYCCCQWDGESTGEGTRQRGLRHHRYIPSERSSEWHAERLWLLAVARDGGNLLNEARARELRRLERVVVSSLRDAAPAALEVEANLELSITSSLFLSNGSLAPCSGGARGDACVQQLTSTRYAERPLTAEEVLLMLQAAQGLQAEQVLY